MSVKLYPWSLRMLLHGHLSSRSVHGHSRSSKHGRMVPAGSHHARMATGSHVLLHQVLLPLLLLLLLLRSVHGSGRRTRWSSRRTSHHMRRGRGTCLVLLELVVHHLEPTGGTPVRAWRYTRRHVRWRLLLLLLLLLWLLLLWRHWRYRLLQWHPGGTVGTRGLLQSVAEHVGQGRLGLLVGTVGHHLTRMLLHKRRLLSHGAHRHLRLPVHLWTYIGSRSPHYPLTGIQGLLLLLLLPLLLQPLKVLQLLRRPWHLGQGRMRLTRPGGSHLDVGL